MSSRQILSKLGLFQEQAFVNGIWQSSASQKTFPVYSPSTGELVANVADCDANDTKKAIDVANQAFQLWKTTSCRERSSLLKDLYEGMMSNQKDLATIMAIESGKPISEGMMEVKFAASFFEWYAGEAMRMNGEVLPNAEPNNRRIVIKQPVGVCGLITPWNFPIGMITRKLGPALAAGCTAVLKPSEETPLTALAFGKIAEEVGMPAGLLNIVTASRENTDQVGGALCDSDVIRKITFTGSTRVGKLLYERSAQNVKRLSMELGGNAPFIVFNSADAKLAAQKAVMSRFRNTGQTCVCAERVFVQDEIYDEFLEELKKCVAELQLGDPLDASTTQSAVINQRALDSIQDKVTDAKEKGASIAVGGNLAESKGSLYYEPTIITDCKIDMKVFKEEIFGPVIPLIKFQSESVGVLMANAHSTGLAGYIMSRDMAQVWRVSEALEVGMVGVNDQAISCDIIPFGGVKESGLGREGSVHGLNDYTELKYIHFGLE